MKTVNVIEYKGKEYLLENSCSGEYETKETTDGRLVVGWLEQDDGAENPLNISDGVGKIEELRRHGGLGNAGDDDNVVCEKLDIKWSDLTQAQKEAVETLAGVLYEEDIFSGVPLLGGNVHGPGTFCLDVCDKEDATHVWIPDDESLDQARRQAAKSLRCPEIEVVETAVCAADPAHRRDWKLSVNGELFDDWHEATMFLESLCNPSGFRKAFRAALIEQCEGILEAYVKWCNGEVYGVITEVFNLETGEHLEEDSCWGYIGYDYAKQELKERMLAYAYATQERIASVIESLKHLEKYGKNCDVRFIARGARKELEAIT